jgi:hypothetical protein
VIRKRFARIPLFLSTGLFALQLWAGQVNQSGQQVFTGEITDTFCAKNKSHEEMMNEMKSMGRDKQTCTQKCAQIGGRYVLYNPAKKEVYTLDDQGKAAAFAGLDVRVVGTLENNQLKIASIASGLSGAASGR